MSNAICENCNGSGYGSGGYNGRCGYCDGTGEGACNECGYPSSQQTPSADCWNHRRGERKF